MMDLENVDFNELWNNFKDKVKDFAVVNPEAKIDHIFILTDENLADIFADVSGLNVSESGKVLKIWIDLNFIVPHNCGWLINGS